MREIDRKGLRTWIEIDTENIKHNYLTIRNLISPSVKLCAVVKSNAYGHSLVDFSKCIEALGIDYIAVDSVVEALRLREEHVHAHILVLGYTLPEMLLISIQKNISITVSHFESLEAVIRIAKENSLVARIHIKIDTGMHRQGFEMKHSQKLVGLLHIEKIYLNLEGVYTHFAEAKDQSGTLFTRKQISLFDSWRKMLAEHDIVTMYHASATGGTLVYPETHLDMVRIGIGLYGYLPSLELDQKSRIELRPILSWRSIIAEIKQIPKGDYVGYDRSYTASDDMTIAVVPIGYWHGYDRRFSNISFVIVNGVYCPVIGRISMDMITIDISNVGRVVIGDVVTLIGKDGELHMSALELARSVDMSYYELLTRINPLIKKIYIK